VIVGYGGLRYNSAVPLANLMAAGGETITGLFGARLESAGKVGSSSERGTISRSMGVGLQTSGRDPSLAAVRSFYRVTAHLSARH
jgi:hypothetical protein